MASYTCEHDKLPYPQPYIYPDGSEAGYLCDSCAVSHGFCPICGAFAGGADDDHVQRENMCLSCFEELEADMSYVQDEDWNY